MSDQHLTIKGTLDAEELAGHRFPYQEDRSLIEDIDLDALTPGEKMPGNMFVPVDLLKPILDEMVKTGGQKAARRPWLGVNSLEEDGRVKVMHVNEESPADKAGVVAGDIILSVNGEPVETLENFYGKLWRPGSEPGTDVKLTVLHGVSLKEVTVRSIDRKEFMRAKPSV